MTVSADMWQARAAMCELLALSFRYPEDKVLAEAIASGEWGEAADEIAAALGLAWSSAAAPGAAEAAALADPADIQKELRPEATRLFVGAPQAACSPYEGVWRATAEGVQPLLFVNPHSMAVERFCKACGLGRPEGTNEPLDAVWTELELLEYLALRAAADAAEAEGIAGDAAAVEDVVEDEDALEEFEDAGEPGEVVASADLPGGSPEAAWDEFMADHARQWMPQFAAAVQEESRVPFYATAANLLGAFIK
ncbi:TorD/DmsD family molecular chaperone [Adlercreutzia caecimuris]|uniref:TorD/DmsD family molecular chaperone n=1 Tax=Adlercreutzia caecimuris TaxID=671266 RepID=UPI0020CCEB21|nr:molecular chaperone TorD family protein [Adlercreutzia caecimuris]MCR2037320.1 molecular chaperone TorD family protein [Adlercreutzia caecimuris]